MMRIVVDQGLPRGTASPLRREGWDVVHVGEIGMSRATDQEILDYVGACRMRSLEAACYP